MTTIYLIRHCEAAGNVGRRFQGHIDADITENGRRQLELLAERFRELPLDAVYSSPLLRARLTAEAVNRHHGLPVMLDDRLMEINGGLWEGRPWAELPALFPQASADWQEAPWRFSAPEGEAMTAVYERMRRALTDIAAAHPGGTVAAASHGCAIRNALCWAHGWPIEHLNEVAWCDNTAVAVLEFDGTQPRLGLFNDASHLNEDLSTLSKQAWWKDPARAFSG